MPRMGLSTSHVVVAGAEFADEVGIESVSLAALAERLGVKPPALYKHVDSIGDLQHRIATLAMTEFGDALGIAIQGRSGAGAISALFEAMYSYIAEHPGRYAAATNARLEDSDDPFFVATARVIHSVRAVLAGYGIPPDERDHAIRMLRSTIHGFALFQTANAFQWSNDPVETVAWMIRFFDAGLTAMTKTPLDPQTVSLLSDG